MLSLNRKKKTRNFNYISFIKLEAKISKKVFDVEKEIKDTLADPKIEFSTSETYLIDRYDYAMRHIQQGLSVEEVIIFQ